MLKKCAGVQTWESFSGTNGTHRVHAETGKNVKDLIGSGSDKRKDTMKEALHIYKAALQ